jgi:hypothetical protein
MIKIRKMQMQGRRRKTLFVRGKKYQEKLGMYFQTIVLMLLLLVLLLFLYIREVGRNS